MDRKNILIIKCGALGDVVRTAFFLPPLYSKFNKAARIDWLTYKVSAELLRYNPYIRRIYTFSAFNLRQIEKRHYDWVISLDDERRICEVVRRLSSDRITGSYVADNGDLAYSEDASEWFDMGLISRFGKGMADLLKKKNHRTHTEIFERMLKIHVDKPCFFNKKKIKVVSFKKIVGRGRKIIGLNLNAGERWPSKMMKHDEAAKLVRYLLNRKFTCVLLGGKDDLGYNRKIISLVKNRNLILFKPVRLLEFAETISRLDLCISSDTLALHLAIAQGVPNISFYSPTSAAEVDTFGTGLKIRSTKSDYCSYRPHADNSTITCNRIVKVLKRMQW
jgi:heptosyltransferase-2